MFMRYFLLLFVSAIVKPTSAQGLQKGLDFLNGSFDFILKVVGFFSTNKELECMQQILAEIKSLKPDECPRLMKKCFDHSKSVCGLVKTPEETVVYLIRVTDAWRRRYGRMAYDYEAQEVEIRMLLDETAHCSPEALTTGGLGSMLPVMVIHPETFSVTAQSRTFDLHPYNCNVFSEYEVVANRVMDGIIERRLACRSSQVDRYFKMTEHYLVRYLDAAANGRWAFVRVKRISPSRYRVALIVQGDDHHQSDTFVFFLNNNRDLEFPTQCVPESSLRRAA